MSRFTFFSVKIDFFWNLTGVKDLTNSKSDYHSDFPSLVLNISLILEWVASLADPGWARRGGCPRMLGGIVGCISFS